MESAMAVERAHLSEVQEELKTLYAKQEYLKKQSESDRWTASENRHLYVHSFTLDFFLRNLFVIGLKSNNQKIKVRWVPLR